ncbi:MAG: hypothetical protein DDT28_00979 [Dehalococcoidia bacterium]|nr:hypothetical protein [Chloroflexota bacterium]
MPCFLFRISHLIQGSAIELFVHRQMAASLLIPVNDIVMDKRPGMVYFNCCCCWKRYFFISTNRLAGQKHCGGAQCFPSKAKVV